MGYDTVDESLQRGVAPEFIGHLTSGVLLPVLERVRHDDTLTLEIRNGYVDVYYRGGRVLGIHGNGRSGRFRAEFDMNYCNIDPAYCPTLPKEPAKSIASEDDAREWVEALASYKQVMDVFFSDHPKLEREFQQNVLRDNNRHLVGERTEYTILDIEYAQSPRAFPENSNFRFDMVGMLWPTPGRNRRSRLATPVLIEMKAGDGALASHATGDGKRLPGLAKHVDDIEAFLEPEPPAATSPRYDLLRTELTTTLRLKQELGLPSIPKTMKTLEIEQWNDRPQVLFILANHQPASTILKKELAKLPPRVHADYFVAKVSYAGYSLFSDNITPLDDFIAEIG
ncbi:MAG: hypothetical protein R2826_03650 [Thermoleophilia bacterium]